MSNQKTPASVDQKSEPAEGPADSKGSGTAEADDLRALMTRYSRGDGAAFRRVFALLRQRVYGFHLRSTGDAEMAEDLTQQTFLKLHVARRRYRAGAAVEPWLFAITKNTQRDAHRRRRRSREHLSDGGELPELTESVANPEPQDVLMQERLAEAIGELPEGQRDVLLLHKFQGLSMREVAEALGIGVSAAKVRAFRAYSALRRLIERGRP